MANGQPVWVAGTAYPGNYVVEHPAGSGNLYIPLESGGVSVGGGEPGIDIHWVLCDGQGPSPGPCEALNVPVWNLTTVAAVETFTNTQQIQEFITKSHMSTLVV